MKSVFVDRSLLVSLTLFSIIVSLHAVNIRRVDNNDELVTSLPGVPGKIPFNLYSGYADIAGGKHFHYIFAESMNDPANDPLVLWLNGGPGCSSLLGFWTEQGPYRFDRLTGGISTNDFAWNKVANVIFLESPAGVGYSYSDSGNTTTDDDQTSLDNLNAVKAFLEKYPQYKKNDFYVTGESYGGVYVPTLSVRLLDEPEINFKAFAVGNGYLDQKLLGNSALYFAYYHGLIPEKLWNAAIDACDCPAKDPCPFSTSSDQSCQSAVSAMLDSYTSDNIDFYDIYDRCDPSTGKESSSRISLVGKNLLRHRSGQKPIRSNGAIPCVNFQTLIDYSNRADVRQALYIPDVAPQWQDCSTINYTNIYTSLKPQVLKVLNAGKYAMIYNGDVDMVCDYLGDRWFVDSLGLKTVDEYRTWADGDQVGGWVQDFTNLSMVTVRGSGHTVPEYKPSAALTLFKAFLQNKPLN